MDEIKRRATYYLISIAALIVVSTLVYDVAMRTFEPGPYPPERVDISLLHSMQVIVETFTATGYGSDSPWKSPEMNALVMLLDLTGVALFFLALPAVFLPLFQRALSPSAPTDAGDIEDHVLICTYTPRAEVLIDELESNGVAYLLVEPDGERATELDQEGYDAVHADPESVSDLERLNIADAKALIADVSDRIDASIVLAAKEAHEDTRVISVVEEPQRERYHELAGADRVLAPRELLARRLADKLTTGVTVRQGDTVSLGEEFDVLEVPIRHGSRLAGLTLAESELRSSYGLNVIGAWYRGEFETPPDPENPLQPGTILLVAGDDGSLDEFAANIRSPVREFRRGETVVIGHGEVGRWVTSALDEANMSYTVIDQTASEAVDVVGDATDPDILRAAGVPDARSVMLAIPDDTSTEFVTLVTRDLNASVEIVVRSDTVEAIRKTYRAGADYVLSLATVTGRSIAAEILEDEDILSVGSTIEIVQTRAPGLAGETLEGAAIRDRTGCTVVAVARDEEMLADLGPDFRIQSEDELIIAGTDAGTNNFVDLFC